jgi:acyl-CoA thioesterase I
MQNSDFQLCKRATSVALSAALLALCTGVAWGQGAQPTKILVLGDSLSAEYGLRRGSGWVALLQSELELGKLQASKGRAEPAGKRYLIQNASISGETTSGGRSRLPDLLARFQPHIVIIELGGNDALRGLDLAMTESNLKDMTQRAQKNQARVLILGMQIPPNFGKAYAEKFSALFAKIASSESTGLVPFLLEGLAEDLRFFQADRIHPTEAAQERIMKNVSKGLKALL